MSNVTYQQFINAIKAQVKVMESTGLFVVDMDKDELYNNYLDSFPAGTNEIYRERREYDCTCCKQFIRNFGGVVTFKGDELVSVWDIQIGGYYQVVVDALSALVKSKPVVNQYLHYEATVGNARSFEQLDGGAVKEWVHFHAPLSSRYVRPKSDIATELGDTRSNKEVLKRSLDELSLDSAETVQELIAQNSLYRGEEHLSTVQLFVKMKKEYEASTNKEAYCWKKSAELKGASKIRNTVIGTLLSDLSAGEDMEAAVKSFEAKVAPTNYKRPTALVTKAMITQAQNTVQELGLVDSLPRRYAVTEDLTINNVLFADRTAKKVMNVFDELSSEVVATPKSFSKVEEIGIEDFIANVLPKAESISVLMENRLSGNLVSLIAPENKEAPGMLKWNNNFSWSYNGEVTDSIKERVKAAGGNVVGDLRVSLSWHNADDLDLHIYEPSKEHIYYRNRRTTAGGYLDVDMNGMDRHDAINPVENVTWADANKLKEGIYRVVVNQFAQRSTDRAGFTLELEFKGQVFTFEYPKVVRHNQSVEVVLFKYSREKGIEIVDSIGHTKSSKEVWGINTEVFQKVSMVMNSPNHWDGEQTGNKHWFFMLEGCANPESTRGFYNEYMNEELMKKHRKVFEILGGKMKAAHTPNQLSGVGFSSTKRDSLTVQVKGSFTRTLKINL